MRELSCGRRLIGAFLRSGAMGPVSQMLEDYRSYSPKLGYCQKFHEKLVNAQIIEREDFIGDPTNGIFLLGNPTPPDPDEVGWKETIRMNPGQVTTVIMKFDLPKVPFTLAPSDRNGVVGNEYVWHCHILEHEEHDMMRPLVVTGPPPLGVFPVTQTAGKAPGVKYSIYNGVPPYTITSDNKQFPPVPATIASSGGQFTVSTGQSLSIKSPSIVTFTIKDSAGTREKVTLALK